MGSASAAINAMIVVAIAARGFFMGSPRQAEAAPEVTNALDERSIANLVATTGRSSLTGAASGKPHICDLDAHAVAWTLADLVGRTSPGVEQVGTALSFRQGGGA